jgi:hypothetical protein
MNVQAWFAEDLSANEGKTYEPITFTGRALGGENE